MSTHVGPPAWIVRPPLEADRKTFCVLGVARGGTSMVSGLLVQLGVHMGERIDPANQEDLEFTTHRGIRMIFKSPSCRRERDEYLDRVRGLIERRNKSQRIWGWKDPIAIYYLPALQSQFENPHYILVSRDSAAIAGAEARAFDDPDPTRLLFYSRRALDEYGLCIDFLQSSDRPLLLISYERALRYPIETVKLCARFVRNGEPEPQDDELRRIAAYIQPDRQTAEFSPEQHHTGFSSAEALELNSRREPLVRCEAYMASLHRRASRETSYDLELENASDRDPPVGTGDWHRRIERRYAVAAAALNKGNRDAALTLACRCLQELALISAAVGVGPARLANALDAEPGSVALIPDLFVGLYNICGIALLQAGEFDAAQAYFEAGHVIARRRVEDLDAAAWPISTELVWWMAFHAALSAKLAKRPNAWRRNVDAIRGQLFSATDGIDNRMNIRSARELYQRALSEGLA